MDKRTVKDILYEQVARIGKATSSPKRLELTELLAQGEKSVEVIADELGIAIKLASAHLKVLKEARLVNARKDGEFVYYQLAGQDVGNLWVAMREVAQEHLVELRVALDEIASAPDKLASCSRKQLMEQAKRGEIIVIDVRPRAESTMRICHSQGPCPWKRSSSAWQRLQRRGVFSDGQRRVEVEGVPKQAKEGLLFNANVRRNFDGLKDSIKSGGK